LNTQASTPRKNFFMVPNDLIDHYGPALGVYGIAILNVLYRHKNNKTGACFPSITTICNLTGTSKTTVNNYLKLLVKLELAVITHQTSSAGDYSSNRYQLLAPQVPVPEHLFDRFSDKAQFLYRMCTVCVHSMYTNCTHSAQPFNDPPSTTSHSTSSISTTEVVRQMATNKTYQQKEVNQTHLNKTDIVSDPEFLKACIQGLKAVFPDMVDEQIYKLYQRALSKKGDDPVAARTLLEVVTKSAAKQKVHIKTPYPWLISAVEKEYKPYFNKPGCSNKKSMRFPSGPKQIAIKKETEDKRNVVEIEI